MSDTSFAVLLRGELFDEEDAHALIDLVNSEEVESVLVLLGAKLSPTEMVVGRYLDEDTLVVSLGRTAHIVLTAYTEMENRPRDLFKFMN